MKQQSTKIDGIIVPLWCFKMGSSGWSYVLTSLTATSASPIHPLFSHLSLPCLCVFGFCFFLATEGVFSLDLYLLRAHTCTYTHTLYLWLRLSVNNANGQQANEHVMADWKGINERTHTHTITHRNTHKQVLHAWLNYSTRHFLRLEQHPGGKTCHLPLH